MATMMVWERDVRNALGVLWRRAKDEAGFNGYYYATFLTARSPVCPAPLKCQPALQVPVGGLGATPLVPKDKMRCERMARVTPNS
jgi:hypothetical protein